MRDGRQKTATLPLAEKPGRYSLEWRPLAGEGVFREDALLSAHLRLPLTTAATAAQRQID